MIVMLGAQTNRLHREVYIRRTSWLLGFRAQFFEGRLALT